MSNDSSSSSAAKPRADDVRSPDAIIKAMYDTISGPAGPRDWYRERSLYLDGAHLVPLGNRVHKESELQVLSLDEWIADVEPFFAENDFYESEIMRKMDRYGNIVQAFSTYEARNSPDAEPFARGINSIQLLKKDDRWWIANVMWENESKDNPIPEEYLPYLW
jgi:hypothetical protein